MRKVIHCLSGLGADEKIFAGLCINDGELRYLPWLRPMPKEELKEYSRRMVAMIDDPFPILLGVSFGGMIAIEMAKEINARLVIIISSVKSSDELPNWMKIAGKLQLNKLLPVRSNKLTEKFDNRQLGITSSEEKMLVDYYRKNSDTSYLNWAINEVLNWKNEWYPDRLAHLHGDMDRMFPIKKMKPTHVIEGGTHIMMLNRCDEISMHINNIIGKY